MKHVSKRERDLPKAVIAKLLKIAAERKDVISLGPGEPDFEAPEPIRYEVQKIIRRYKKNRVTHYSAPQGIPELREAIAKKLKKDNKINVKPENVLVSAGSQEALFAALLSTVDPKEEVLIQNPGYMGYLPAIELVSAVPKYVRLSEKEKFEINPDRMEKAVTRKTRVIMLNTPANPTGSVIRKKVLEEIADIAVDKDLYVFADEAYEKLVYGDKKHVSIGSLNGMKDYVVTFQSFSKSFAMCGFRLGYAAGPKEIIKAMNKSKHYMTLCPPHLSQLVGVKALKLSKWHITKMKFFYKKRRDYLVKRLNEMELATTMPDGAFYTFSNIKKYSKDSYKFADKLLKKEKVAVVPGKEFGRYGEGYIRCSYATKLSKIKKAMNRLEKFLKKR